MWVDCDDDHIVINTEVALRKFKNVQADPRVTVTIWGRKNPYFFAEVRGRVVEVVPGPQARANIDALAQKYLGTDPLPQMSRLGTRELVHALAHRGGYRHA